MTKNISVEDLISRRTARSTSDIAKNFDVRMKLEYAAYDVRNEIVEYFTTSSIDQKEALEVFFTSENFADFSYRRKTYFKTTDGVLKKELPQIKADLSMELYGENSTGVSETLLNFSPKMSFFKYIAKQGDVTETLDNYVEKYVKIEDRLIREHTLLFEWLLGRKENNKFLEYVDRDYAQSELVSMFSKSLENNDPTKGCMMTYFGQYAKRRLWRHFISEINEKQGQKSLDTYIPTEFDISGYPTEYEPFSHTIPQDKASSEFDKIDAAEYVRQFLDKPDANQVHLWFIKKYYGLDGVSQGNMGEIASEHGCSKGYVSLAIQSTLRSFRRQLSRSTTHEQLRWSD